MMLSGVMHGILPQLPAACEVAVHKLGQAGADKLAVVGSCGGCSTPASQCSCQLVVLQHGQDPRQQLLLGLLLLHRLRDMQHSMRQLPSACLLMPACSLQSTRQQREFRLSCNGFSHLSCSLRSISLTQVWLHANGDTHILDKSARRYRSVTCRHAAHADAMPARVK